MDHQLTGHLTWSTDPTVPGWQLTIEAGPGRPATRLSLGTHVAQDASQQELQTLLADAFHQYTGALPNRIDLLIPADTGEGSPVMRPGASGERAWSLHARAHGGEGSAVSTRGGYDAANLYLNGGACASR